MNVREPTETPARQRPQPPVHFYLTFPDTILESIAGVGHNQRGLTQVTNKTRVMQSTAEYLDLDVQSKGRQHRPVSSHRAWDYFSHPPGSIEAEKPFSEPVPSKAGKFGSGFQRRPRDTSIEIRKEAEREAREREKYRNTQQRRELLTLKDQLNGYDVITGAVYNHERVSEDDRRMRPQRRHFSQVNQMSPIKYTPEL